MLILGTTSNFPHAMRKNTRGAWDWHAIAQEIVLGGSCQGVPLQGATFNEPGSGEASAHRGINQRELRWARCAARRDARFEAVYDAIDRLILWAKT